MIVMASAMKVSPNIVKKKVFKNYADQNVSFVIWLICEDLYYLNNVDQQKQTLWCPSKAANCL